MIECHVTDFQPGTGTRYLLIHGIVPPEDARKIGCDSWSLYLNWHGQGSGVFTESTHPNYVAEKLKLDHYMLDAEAITQFIKHELEVDHLITGEDWSLCKNCGLPEYKNRCNCKARPLYELP
ncbi:MAG: hypothetical protein DRP09_10380 [Candidatus Thorarchaeota archaeon]|nr:MAG: hypothetical protein DRP09_10380 [Candidatus Thorarchaeota archaeon]